MKIWFIDDDRDDLEFIDCHMRRKFPEVEVEFFTFVPEKLDCDALFIDLFFGRLNGYEIATEYRKKGVKIPIIIMTGASESPDPSVLQHVDWVAYKNHPSSLVGAVAALSDICEDA